MVNLYEELGSYRAVAALVGCDHKTVKATLERAGQAKGPYPRRSQLADPYLDMIAARWTPPRVGSTARPCCGPCGPRGTADLPGPCSGR
ncbi:MAG: hypothetical protein NVS3B24_03830 [Candidatus Dormibacteria bacterium]